MTFIMMACATGMWDGRHPVLRVAGAVLPLLWWQLGRAPAPEHGSGGADGRGDGLILLREGGRESLLK